MIKLKKLYLNFQSKISTIQITSVKKHLEPIVNGLIKSNETNFKGSWTTFESWH